MHCPHYGKCISVVFVVLEDEGDWLCTMLCKLLKFYYTNVSSHIQDSDHSEDPNIPAIAHPLLWPLPPLQLPGQQLRLQEYLHAMLLRIDTVLFSLQVKYPPEKSLETSAERFTNGEVG